MPDLPTVDLGSSPRERGARSPYTEAIAQMGLIPAGAGSTTPRARPMLSFRAHPRGSGEHSIPLRSREPVQGSSPRERGAPHWAQVMGVLLGLIPAGAGSTSGGR